jgi:translation initiation factor 2 subunit 1
MIMALGKREWPDVGDLVISTVERITDYGAYVRLDEYNKEGLLHISEVSSTWVRNIRDFVREGQKAVLRVLRVDQEKEHVDLSLRRVTKRERREKVLSWKKERKAESLLRTASERLNISEKELYEKAGVLVEKEFGEMHGGLEKTAREGAEVLVKLGVPKDMAATIEEIAKERIRLPVVMVKGTLELQCTKPNGAVLVRDALLDAQRIKKSSNTEVRIYVVAPPRYRIEVLAEDYKEAEKLLSKATQTALKSIVKFGGQGVFRREK